MTIIVSREEAERLVAPHVSRIGGFVFVTREAAEALLGPERLAMLLADPIRRHGVEGGIYPWNVVDYLCNENPRARAKQ